MLQLVCRSLPIHNLASPQLGLGSGLTFVFRLAFIARCSGIRFLAPTELLSILDSSIQESGPTSPEPRHNRVHPGYTLLRFLAPFLCLPAAGALVMAVLEAKQDAIQAALPDVARSHGDLGHFLDIEKDKEPPGLVLSDSGEISDGRRKCAPTKHSATMASSQSPNVHRRASATPKNSQLVSPRRANLPRALVRNLLARLGPCKFSSPLRHRRNPHRHRPVEEQLTPGFQSGRFVSAD